MTAILFRKSLAEDNEFEICKKYFKDDVIERRSQILRNELVIGRYSVLPYYNELADDLLSYESRLINSYSQHKWIANFDYYNEVKDYTPETWTSDEFTRCNYPGPFVVKGCTNSRKFYWNSQMFAKDKSTALKISCDLWQDSMIGMQDIIYRKYIPLNVYEYGCYNLPFSNEWRIFCLGDKILSKGYYWSSASEETIKKAKWSIKADMLLSELIPIVKSYVNFYVLDIAETESGDWILIELNDAQMAGLSENDPNILYSNLKEYLDNNGHI
jgi:hypothetical protein